LYKFNSKIFIATFTTLWLILVIDRLSLTTSHKQTTELQIKQLQSN
jgi:hypothetical protein